MVDMTTSKISQDFTTRRHFYQSNCFVLMHSRCGMEMDDKFHNSQTTDADIASGRVQTLYADTDGEKSVLLNDVVGRKAVAMEGIVFGHSVL